MDTTVIPADPAFPARPAAPATAGRLDVAAAQSRDGVSVLAVSGELDRANVHVLIRTVDSLAARGEVKLVLDLRRLYFVDAAGLLALRDIRALLALHHGWLCLAAVRPRVHSILARAGLDKVFTIRRTLDEAVRGEGRGHPAHVAHAA